MKRLWLKRAMLLAIFAAMGIAAFSRIDFAMVHKSFISLHVLQQLGTMVYVGREIGGFVENRLLMRRLDSLPKDEIRKLLRESRLKDEPLLREGPLPHVVLLQMESIEANAINAQQDGKYVMDFLRELAARSLYFDNVVDQTSAGRTSDAEFLVLTSQIPLRDAPVYTSQDLAQIPSLPKALAAAGYRTASLHGFKGAFWNRKNNHARLGFQTSWFMEDMEKEEKLGWGVSDFAAVDRSLDILAAAEEPQFLFTVLLSSHHPYPYVREAFKLEDRGMVHDYLYSLAYVDDAVERFFAGLEREGLLDDTIVIVYGDHESGISEGLREQVIEPVDAPDSAEEILFLAHGLSRNGRISRPVGLQDVAPMLLNELGLPVPATFAGNHFDVEHAVLLPNNRMIEGVADGKFAVSEAPVDLRHMTLLAIHMPQALTGEGAR